MKRDSELYCVNASVAVLNVMLGVSMQSVVQVNVADKILSSSQKNKGMIQTIVVGKIFLVNAVTRNVYIWCQFYEDFYGRNLRIFAIS